MLENFLKLFGPLKPTGKNLATFALSGGLAFLLEGKFDYLKDADPAKTASVASVVATIATWGPIRKHDRKKRLQELNILVTALAREQEHRGMLDEKRALLWTWSLCTAGTVDVDEFEAELRELRHQLMPLGSKTP